MSKIKFFDDFINEDYNDMNKKVYTFDERTGKYYVFGQEMPKEFIDAYENNSLDFSKFKKKIVDRNKTKTGRILSEPFRFSEKLPVFLRNVYKGDLPRDIISLAKCFDDIENYEVDLFKLSEETYKQKYKNEYDEFFNNRTLIEKEKIFHSADFGWRTIYELEQDTVASNIFERMLKYHGFNHFIINEKATGGNESSTINKKCDLIYNDENIGIRFPIEVKTKWKRYLNDIEYISMRDNAETLKKDRGMILAVYLGLEHEGVKAVVIDSVGNTTTKGQMSVVNKSSENYNFNSKELMNFNFWDEKDMKDMLDNISLIYKKRGE